MIIRRERKRHADGRGLLPDREVRRSGVIVSYALVSALSLDLVENGFELADGAHVAPDGEEVLARKGGALFVNRLVVRVDGDGGELDGLRGKYSFGLDDDGLRHFVG